MLTVNILERFNVRPHC